MSRNIYILANILLLTALVGGMYWFSAGGQRAFEAWQFLALAAGFTAVEIFVMSRWIGARRKAPQSGWPGVGAKTGVILTTVFGAIFYWADAWFDIKYGQVLGLTEGQSVAAAVIFIVLLTAYFVFLIRSKSDADDSENT
jgi:hypothetical protein